MGKQSLADFVADQVEEVIKLRLCVAELEAVAEAARNVRGDTVVDVAWGDEYRLIRIPVVEWQALGNALDALATELAKQVPAQQAVSEMLDEDGYIDTLHLGC